MIQHVWSVLCKHSVIDKDTNNISMFDILEQLIINNGSGIKSNKTGVIIPIEYEIINFWTTDKKDVDNKSTMRVDIYNPEGKKEKTFEQKLEIPKGNRRLRTRLQINGFLVKIPGIYVFEVSYLQHDKYKKVAALPLEIILKD